MADARSPAITVIDQNPGELGWPLLRNQAQCMVD
jgi:hypothetical protein